MNPENAPAVPSPPPWSTAGGDNSRRGCFGRAAHLRPRPVHQLRATGAVLASVVFDQAGTAFVADMAGSVQAFGPDGRRTWRVSLGAGISATPAVDPQRSYLFVATQRGTACALATADGSVQWRREIPTRSDPRILSDLLYISRPEGIVLSSWGGRFCVLDATTGEERFTWDAGYYPGAAAATGPEGHIYCLRAMPGQGVELLRVEAGAGEVTVLHRQPEGPGGARRALVAAAPVVDSERGRLYAVLNTDRHTSLLAWSLTSQTIAWEHPFEHCVQATPAVRRDGTIVVAELSPSVHAIGTDGSTRFRYAGDCEYWLAGPVVDAEGTILIGDSLGALHKIAPSGEGRRVFEAKRSIQARPSFDAAGRLYLPATDHSVYVLAG